MGSNKKQLLIGLAVVVFGISTSASVFASAITDSYATGDTLTATHMTNIKTHANETDTRLGGVIANTQAGALKTLVDNHNGNLANGTCVKNAGDVVDGMVRVGSICVDKFRARATIGACTGDGSTDCAGVIALSTGAGSPAADFSWAQAVRACANAGKRLLTPGEFMAAYISGALLETAPDTYDFVDALLTIRSTNAATDTSGPGVTQPAQGSYIGPSVGTTPTGLVQMISNVGYNLVNPDGGSTVLFFRCAR